MNPLQVLEGPLEDLLNFLHDKGNLTYGWAIVVLTVIVRVLLIPLFVGQYRSARRMQQIAPQLKGLKTKYANDKRKQQEEMMRLFQENKVNPFGSCLPIVFQIPIFIALFYVLRDFSGANQGDNEDLSFMWVIPDISEQFRSMGWTAIIVAIIYGASQLLATEVSMATTPQTSDLQRKLFRVMPVFIVGGLFLYPDIPAGLVLYWMTTNLWTGGQQVVLKRRLGPLEMVQPLSDGGGAVAKAESSSPKPKPQHAKKPAKPAVATSGAEPETESPAVIADAPAPRRTPPAPRPRPANQKRRPPKKR